MRLAALTRCVGALALSLVWGAAALAETPPQRERSVDATIREDLRDWRLRSAETALRAYNGDGALVLKARLDLMRGRFAEVRKRLLPTIDRLDFEARVVLGQALQAMGRRDEAFRVLDAMADDYNDDRVTTARDLTWLGIGLMLTDYPKNAHRVFKEALALEPLDETRLAWAELYLSKYDYRAADPLFREVAARQPHHVRAVLGMARVAIESDRAFAEAHELVRPLTERYPECVPCHNVLALVALHNERPDEARDRLETYALATSPADPEALALLGAATYLMDDRPAFRAVEKRALALDTKNAAFYTTVAEHAEREHRYVEALGLLEQALILDPDHSAALSALGTAYSRTGRDDRARATLDKAFAADPFNVRTYNLLRHFYDQVDQRFTWVEVQPMRLRIDKREAPILSKVVPPLMREAEAALSARYGFAPRPPLHVEIFADPQTFAVRSTGLPGLAAHGICFGHVITARSPSAGNFNWAEVLWHELAHVYHLELARGRVPRWFTEGLAVYESTLGRPAWDREQDPELLSALRAKKLRGVEDFNLAFTQARSLEDILVAYYHAYYVTRFIHAAWGFEKAREMLRLWGAEKKTAEVFQTALGVSPAEFDQRFFEWLAAQLAYLDRAYPGSGADSASETLTTLEALRRDGRAGVEALTTLATLAEQANDLRRAASFLEEAIALDPKEPRLRRRLVATLDKLGFHAEAYRARRGLMRVDQMDAALAIKALELAPLHGASPAEAAELAEQAVHIAPFSPDVHLTTARAFAALGDKARVAQAVELLLLLVPGHPEAATLLAP